MNKSKKENDKDDNNLRWSFFYWGIGFLLIALFFLSMGGIESAAIFGIFSIVNIWISIFASKKVVRFISDWTSW